jgi:hypothetical protein
MVRQFAQHAGASQHPTPTARTAAHLRTGIKRCYLEHHQFRTPLGEIVGAADLSAGSKVLDHQEKEVEVEWCAVHPKKQRLFVDLHTRSTMFTVTDTHRIVLPDGKDIEARELKKGDDVCISSSCRAEKLVKVTKCYRYTKVIELIFEGDAIMAAIVPSILTKGADPSASVDWIPGINIKEESVDDQSAMSSASENEGCFSCNGGSPMANREFWPDTDEEWT